MGETIQELLRELEQEATACRGNYDQGRKEEAKESARRVLSLGSKIHQRLGILVDIERDARWTAAVDRAVKQAPAQLPGQMSIVDAVKDKPKRAPRKK